VLLRSELLKLPYCGVFFTLNTYGASAPVTDDSKIGPVPEGRGEPSSLEIIRITNFAKKSDQVSRFFVLNRSLRRFTHALRNGGPRAGTPAPQCGTGVPARQIVEAAWKLAKLQTPALRDWGPLFVFEYRRFSTGLFSEPLSEARRRFGTSGNTGRGVDRGCTRASNGPTV